MADAALVVRGVGHPPVALTLLGLCDRALAEPAARPRGGRGCSPSAPPPWLSSAIWKLPPPESAAAMAAAAAAGDPAAELDAIRARVAALSAPQHRAERLRLGTRAVELATRPVSRSPRCSAGCGGSTPPTSC